ncbi:hypothetical protein SUGI_1146160 [Cryptomeria japonica]|nr:hypothetical protein SUGI_1146160 [Cryptomeria japonica]
MKIKRAFKAEKEQITEFIPSQEKQIHHQKEKNLRAVISVKDIIKKEPEACLPIDALSRKKKKLGIRSGVSNFIKKYPSIFELCNGNKCKLTKEVLELEEEEARIHQEQESDAATRLCKLLMMTREKKLHLDHINQLKWDMGLPQNYVKTLVPNFPDYFSVINMPDNRPGLDLVCWNDTLAVSEMERRAANKGEYKKTMPLAFPLNYSKGYAVKQGYVKWAEEWQRLPYISPYEHASHIDPLSDLSERRVVGVLHELLSLMVSKRTVRRYLIDLREQLGLPEKFEKCFDRHPGIFYVSLKNGTVTVVLREAYKRDKLIEEHPLMKCRGKFLHVMKKGFGDKRKCSKKGVNSQEKDSVAGENLHALEKSHDDHEGNSEDEELQEGNSEDEESQEEESSDDRNYARKDFGVNDNDDDDDEEEEVTTDEESSEDDKDVCERDFRTHGKQRGRLQSSGKQASNLSPSDSQGSDSKPFQRQRTNLRKSILEEKNKRTLGKQGKSFDTYIKKGSGYQTFGEGRNFETSGRIGRNFEKSGRQGRNFEKSGRNFETSGRQGRNFETTGRNFEKSGRQGRNFETPGRNFETSGRQGRNFEKSGRQGRSFETSGRKERSSETSGRQDRHFETSGKKGRSSGTSARMQVRSFDTSGRRENNFKTSERQRGTSQLSRKQGNKFEFSRSRDSKSRTSGSQGSNFEVPQSRGTRNPSQKQSGNPRVT